MILIFIFSILILLILSAISQDHKASCITFFFSSGKWRSESLEQPGRRRRSKRRFSSLTNLTDLTPTGKKASGGRRRRNSISLDDIQNLKRFAVSRIGIGFCYSSHSQVVPWKRRRAVGEQLPSVHLWNQQEVLPVHWNQSQGENRVGSFSWQISK